MNIQMETHRTYNQTFETQEVFRIITRQDQLESFKTSKCNGFVTVDHQLLSELVKNDGCCPIRVFRKVIHE